MRINELFNFIYERHAIYQRRAQGKPKPWTKDLILQQYKFCNVYRELDTVTQWIANNWRWPHREDPNLWFAMCVARLVNWPVTMEEMKYPVPWNPRHFMTIMNSGTPTGKRWGGAYIVSTNGNKISKEIYIAERVLTPLWDDRKAMTEIYQGAKYLNVFHQYLMEFDGLGSFLAAQVIADLKYVSPLCKAYDWHTWAASGPGSRRGLNRVFNKPVDSPWLEGAWLHALQTLHKEITSFMKAKNLPELHAQDLQNCLCEFDKYERTRLGEGRPRSRYQGAA